MSENSVDIKTKNKNEIKEVFEWIKVIILAVIIALTVRYFFFEIVEVRQISMENTLIEGQKLIKYNLWKFIGGDIKYNDIVIFKASDEEKLYIKRVIAIEGDTIQITKDGKVFVNGEELFEPYIKNLTYYGEYGKEELTVPANQVFVMGDNRMHSKDSRTFGPVDIKDIKGKAIYRIWPLNEFGEIN